MQHERRINALRSVASCRSLLLIATVALGVGNAGTVHGQSSTGSAAVAGTPAAMRALAPPIVTDLKDKENLSGILMTRVVTLPSTAAPDNKPVITGLTTSAHQTQSLHRELQQNQKLEFTVDDSSPQEIVIRVTISKSALAGNPQDAIQTDRMSIGFLRGTNTCWQECWREGGKKICDQVCY